MLNSAGQISFWFYVSFLYKDPDKWPVLIKVFMIINNFEVKQMLHCIPTVQIIKKESSKVMMGDHSTSLAKLLRRNVIIRARISMT